MKQFSLVASDESKVILRYILNALKGGKVPPSEKGGLNILFYSSASYFELLTTNVVCIEHSEELNCTRLNLCSTEFAESLASN